MPIKLRVRKVQNVRSVYININLFGICSILSATIMYYSHHLNRADYLLNYSFQHNTILDKNFDCDDPNDVENILEIWCTVNVENILEI